jgi:hypothetical protein
MYQSWGSLLFMHWRTTVEALRPYVPEPLEIDTFDGVAWIAITPFTMWNVRPVFVPPVPFVSAFHEINVRTYVHLDRVPGVWFFSLDANSILAVAAARALYGLPYHNAAIELDENDGTVDYKVRRKDSTDARAAAFAARWHTGAPLPQAVPGSLEFFLTERYCLYAAAGGKLYRCRIYHPPWPLSSAVLGSYSTTLFEADGLPVPAGEPIVHAGGPVDVEIWPLTGTDST